MKRFLLSRDTSFPFQLFGFQHISCLVLTLLLFILIYVFKDKIKNINNKHLRIIIGILLLVNMLTYRLSYMYYGVYDNRIHLSFYYCHIINYLFVLGLWINYKGFYKVLYGLAWCGSLWAMLFPDLSGGIDCFIFYNSFISHNMLVVFIGLMCVINDVKITFKDCLKTIFYAIIIVLITYAINHDFGTIFNTPFSFLKRFTHNYYLLYTQFKYVIMILLGLVGTIVGLIIYKLIGVDRKCSKNI